MGASVGLLPSDSTMDEVDGKMIKTFTDGKILEGSITPVPANFRMAVLAKNYKTKDFDEVNNTKLIAKYNHILNLSKKIASKEVVNLTEEINPKLVVGKEIPEAIVEKPVKEAKPEAKTEVKEKEAEKGKKPKPSKEDDDDDEKDDKKKSITEVNEELGKTNSRVDVLEKLFKELSKQTITKPEDKPAEESVEEPTKPVESVPTAEPEHVEKIKVENKNVRLGSDLLLKKM